MSTQEVCKGKDPTRSRSIRSTETVPDEQPSKEIERAVFQGASTGNYAIIVTDHAKADEPIAYVNHAFEELTGYKLAEVIGFHPHFLRTDERSQAGVKELELAMRSGRACSAVLHDYRKNKTSIWYQVNISPVFNQSKKLTHFFGCLRDVTAVIEAKETEEDRETFIATLAHDLRSPLAGADRMFALIIDSAFGTVSVELQEILVLLSNGNKKALDLVMNLLESYRLRKGIELMHFETVNLPQLIEATVQEVTASLTESRELTIPITVSKDFPPCFFDRMAISRLVTNLLDNAVKFSAPRGTVQISAESVNDRVVLKVTDTGVGIPSEDHDLVFQKYKRSRSKNRYTSGCGLGLYICRQIVKAHDGQISFVSQVGVGTTFTVVLPIKSAMAKSAEDNVMLEKGVLKI